MIGSLPKWIIERYADCAAFKVVDGDKYRTFFFYPDDIHTLGIELLEVEKLIRADQNEALRGVKK